MPFYRQKIHQKERKKANTPDSRECKDSRIRNILFLRVISTDFLPISTSTDVGKKLHLH